MSFPAVSQGLQTAPTAHQIIYKHSKAARPTQQRRGMRLQALAPLAAAAGAVPAGVGVAAAAAAAAVAATLALRKLELRPNVQGQSTSWNSAILSLCPTLTAPYRLAAGELAQLARRPSRLAADDEAAAQMGECCHTTSVAPASGFLQA